MNEKSVEKRGVLPGSSMPVKAGVRDEKGNKIKPLPPKEYDAAGEIKKFGLVPTEVVEYMDPFEGVMKKIMIDRRGTTDEKLALALLDDKVNREQKDTMISMYLFEKGKEGASMLMDLWGYKGQHTKESRAFQSMMRFDFEMFLNAFEMYLHDAADKVFNTLPIEVVEVEQEVDGKKIKKEIVRCKDTNYARGVVEIMETMGEVARYQRMTATLLAKRIRAEVQKRERAKGKGIYVGMDNKPYSVFEDGDIVEVVQRDKAAADEQKLDREKMGERVKAGVCVRCDKPAVEHKLYCEEHNI